MSTSGCQGGAGQDLPGKSKNTCEEVQGQVWQITSGNLDLFHWLGIYACALQYMPGFIIPMNSGWQQGSATWITNVSNGLCLQSSLENAFIDTSLPIYVSWCALFDTKVTLNLRVTFVSKRHPIPICMVCLILDHSAKLNFAQVAGMHFRFMQKQVIPTVLSDNGLVFKDQSPRSSDFEMGDLVAQAAESWKCFKRLTGSLKYV